MFPPADCSGLDVKAPSNSENEGLSRVDLEDAINKYKEVLIEARVWVMAKELHPSSNGLELSFPVHNGVSVLR